MSDFLPKGSKVRHDGVVKTVKQWNAQWSLALRHGIPHRLWIQWEGETKATSFVSDNEGNFHGIELVEKDQDNAE